LPPFIHLGTLGSLLKYNGRVTELSRETDVSLLLMGSPLTHESCLEDYVFITNYSMSSECSQLPLCL